ncbi:MAG: TetR/AcrR family transcriptional regulator [Bacteroidales bacterium]|nr:TetR/AcrR family transcriptional regulator [Bacteroidales bacterium]MCM1414386.1 TetR/AcrR family transcriptional regulator [bacterium]MCM1422266.1 TetR/AcrR family transcriptional regulator [bacterium]
MATREEQKEQRRQLILEKALELFVKRGYSDTKIGDIAKAAQMSTGLMFHYFDSKEQLYETLVRMGADGTNLPQKLPYKDPLAFFEGFLDTLFTYATENPWVFHMFILMAQARRSEGIPAHIREIALRVNQVEQSAKMIEAGQKQGCIRKGDPYVLSFTFWSSVQGIMEQLASAPALLEEGRLPETDWIIDIIRIRKEK